MPVGINEQKFYDALSDLFVGAKIEGQGGYVNLMKIKSHYYELVLQKFKEEVDNDPLLQDSFREEFFDKLYDFFHRYFSETGSVFFVKTSPYQKIYERIYSPDKDVALFCKTHVLYYVKSDILFKNMEVEISDEIIIINNAVLKSFAVFSVSLYSAAYFTIPWFIPPVDTVVTMPIKF